MDKYLFLDIDGVLNTMVYARACQWKYGTVRDEDGAFFDPEAVRNLKYILDCVPAKLIISSSWRKNGMEWMKQLWKKRNLPGEIYSLTPIIGKVEYQNIIDETSSFSYISYAKRGLEINEWLKKNTNSRTSPYEYAIIDDEDDFLFVQSENLIIPDPETGLTKEVADRVIELLDNHL